MQNLLKTVLPDDMERLMESLGLWGSLEEGKLNCSHCKKTLSKERIFGIYPISGDIKVACNSSDCIQKTIEQSENLNPL